MFDAVFADGMKLGLELGMLQAMLAHLTTRKFGPEAGNRLLAFVAGVTDPERLFEIGCLLIDSADGEEFLSRTASSVEWH